MRKLLRLGGIYSALSILIASSMATVALAAASASSTGTGNGYKISPVRVDLTVNKGASQTVTVYVQNVSSAKEDLQVVVNDFQARNDESGAPALLLNGQKAGSHGLKQYISILNPTLSLQPNEQKAISVRISIPGNAVAGGYYGAIRVAPAGAVGDKNINLAASVASLILVKVPGNLTEQLSIAGFSAESKNGSPHTIFTSDKGLKAAVRFQNSGNIQEQPFGKILLKKGSKILKTYEINNSDLRGNVLPDSIRKFTVDLGKVGSFGKYTLQGSFGYGSNGQLLSASTTFYIIPVGIVVLALVILLVVLFLIFGLPKIIRGHDQRVLRRASRR